MKKLDLIMTPISQYGVLQHFTKELHKAFLSLNVKSNLFVPKRDDPKGFTDAILKDKPEYTLSFNGILPDPEGRFLCDLIDIPHISFLVDAPNQFLSLTKSKNTFIITVDQSYVNFYKGMGFERAYFVPHGIEESAKGEIEYKRTRDIVFLASFIDFEAIQKRWLKTYAVPVVRVLEKTAELFIENEKEESLLECFSKALAFEKFVDPSTLDLPFVLQEIEDFIVGKERTELLKALDKVSVEVVGSGWDKWKGRSSLKGNISFKEMCTYEQSLQYAQEAKIVLNSSPVKKQGLHERTLMGGIKGSLVATNGSSFTKENFKEDLLYFYPKNYGALQDLCIENLKNFEQTHAQRERVQKTILEHHTWKNRAEKILEIFY